ncbi:hypothetical protein FIBSPDRAFT_1041213 [Athelia psychrophila]|uniref:Ubiquitin 3 binding protein But2 C-terminal domain-containing protein n=1 Tax=Athelia psychrophila TaxID=1759441 RepID=A0A166P9A3_9AGAM|nr:hypothetical protein FIBSPDRAFT_1041213 [Fibularhizoctonia sp. CBS 109695]
MPLFSSRSGNASTEYISLAPSDEDVADAEKQYTQGARSSTPRFRSLYLAIFAVGALCVFNFAQTNFFPPTPSGPSSQASSTSKKAQVAVSADPKYAYTAPGRIVRVSAGSKSAVFGESNSVHISVEDNTFMEFAVPRGSASTCQLAFIPPPAIASTRLIGALSEIEAWDVSAPPSTYDDVSWRNRPKGEKLLATLDLSGKIEALSQEFDCGAQDYRTIEFRCLRVACGVEYYADGMSGFELRRRV